jgi:CheY-like chemotaxis protein
MSKVRTRRILVIDDEERVRMLFAEFVAALGYEPDPVGDPAEGLARAATGGYDLVLTDLVMPGRINGLDVAETLRQQSPELPVIIISAVAGTAEADTIRRRGFAFLEKPIKLPAFRAELERMLGPPAPPEEVSQAS